MQAEEKCMKDWKSKISKSRIGERADLKSAEGFWIKPRKFSVEENDIIQEAQLNALKDVNRGMLARATQKMMASTDSKSGASVIDILSDDDISALLDAKFAPSSAILRLHLLHGVAEHNFCEEESSTLVNAALVDDLLKYPEIATEIGLLVQGFNSPLAKPTSGTSGTSPDGSTGEPSLR
jgi:hypothetical protein